MKLISYALGKLLPNPHRRYICGGQNDPEKVSKLRAEIERSDFWPGVLVRFSRNGMVFVPKATDGFDTDEIKAEIVVGHHRVAAAIEAKRPDFKTYLGVVGCGDTEMLRLMCSENSYRDMSHQE